MSLYALIQKSLEQYREKGRTKSLAVDKIEIFAPHGWDLRVSFELGEKGTLTIRNVSLEDTENLKKFRDKLSQRSRDLVPCYPWDDEQKLEEALAQALQKAADKTDAAYLIEHESGPIGHFFLWKAGGNPHSQQHNLDIPELGVAIADDFHRLGLGTLAVNLLQALAHSLNLDAVELTTAQSNDAGWHTYLKAGFEYTGDIQNPLDVDVTDAFAGQAAISRVRTERQMIYVINQDKKEGILEYLKQKRKQAAKFESLTQKQA